MTKLINVMVNTVVYFCLAMAILGIIFCIGGTEMMVKNNVMASIGYFTLGTTIGLIKKSI